MKYIHHRPSLFFSFLLILIFSHSTQILLAQNATSSPYSRFGIGDLNTGGFARNLSLGGTEIGLNQPGFINYGNPASYSSLWFTTYEAGLDFKQYEFKSLSKEHRTHTSSFSYFDFAFPIKAQKWSLGFGLLPYSNTGYSITEKRYSAFAEDEIRTYNGSGGLNNFHIGTGFKASKNLSLGLNTEYLFGVINNDRTVSYTSPYYYNTEINSSTSIGWFHFKAGLQYKIDSLPVGKSDSIINLEKKIELLNDSLSKLIGISSGDSSSEIYVRKNLLASEISAAKTMKNNVVNRRAKSDWNLVLGLVASPAANLRARSSYLAHSFRYFSYANPEQGVLQRDTIVNIEGQSGNVRLPLSAGLGFSLTKGNNWVLCGDYSFQQWSDFLFLNSTDSLVDSWKINAGVQFTPNDRAIKSYWKTMQYRLGFHYEQTYLKLNEKNINDIGISAGFGLPVRKAGTILHFTFEAGKRGTTENNLILEKYLKFTFGFTINDRWFVKPKYD